MQFNRLRRHDFITLGGTAATWRLAAHAQRPATPVIGFVNAGSLEGYRPMVAAFRQGLQQSGYAEGRDIAIEYPYGQKIQPSRVVVAAVDHHGRIVLR
jgi:putative tryptophan/tyrosine transport system substrate-binding protein